MSRTVSKTQLVDSDNIPIDPATEDKQDDIIAAIEASGGGPASGVADAFVTIIAGTPVQLPDRACKRVFIQNIRSNTGKYVVVGGATVVASTYRGKTYMKTQGDWHDVENSNLLYVDGDQSGDQIALYYETS